jgi:hypothetical protein
MILLLLMLASAVAFSQDEEPDGFSLILGPRVGAMYLITTPAEFTEKVNQTFEGSYFPVVSLFGLILEQRILLGETNSHFAFQEMVLVGGLEQSIALLSGVLLIGYRAASGFEFGIGPSLSISGIGVIIAVGWTFSYSGVNVPIDLGVTLPNASRPMSISLTTGFNFKL